MFFCKRLLDRQFRQGKKKNDKRANLANVFLLDNYVSLTNKVILIHLIKTVLCQCKYHIVIFTLTYEQSNLQAVFQITDILFKIIKSLFTVLVSFYRYTCFVMKYFISHPLNIKIACAQMRMCIIRRCHIGNI